MLTSRLNPVRLCTARQICIRAIRCIIDRNVDGNNNSWSRLKRRAQTTKKKFAPDEFGSLPTEREIEKYTETPLDTDEINFVPDQYKKFVHPDQYAPLIKDLIAKGKVQESLNVLTTRMLKEDRVQPNTYVYNILLGAFGRIGHIDMAFKLFKQMKERELKPNGATYTSLFNACANCSDRDKGLYRAKYLREKIKEKNWILNTTNYNAMIKAFGRCGDVSTAFELADEMCSEHHCIGNQTLSFLLQACASQKQNGFLLALEVWQKFYRGGLLPDVFIYNLLLRIIRDCGAVQIESNCGSNSETTNRDSAASGELIVKNFNLNLLNPHEIIPTMNLPTERLRVLGGAVGFVNHMVKNKVEPNVKTLTLLLEITESSLEHELELLEIIKRNKIQIDIDFFNILIKKRNFRHDNVNAKETLNLIREYNLCPDIVTFGVLALGCRAKKETLQFINDMQTAGFQLNLEIIGSLVKGSCMREEWDLVETLLRIVHEEEIEVDENFVNTLEKGIKITNKNTALAEKGFNVSTKCLNPRNKANFQHFLVYYKHWLTTTKLRRSTEDVINSIVQ